MYTMDEFQKVCALRAVYPFKETGNTSSICYTLLGLVGEAGEIANKYKKVLRGDVIKEDFRSLAKDELGDVMWYIAMLAKELNLSLNDIAEANVEKLRSRAVRGVLKGSGDSR